MTLVAGPIGLSINFRGVTLKEMEGKELTERCRPASNLEPSLFPLLPSVQILF